MKIDVMMTEAVFRRFTVFDILRRRKMWRAPAIFGAILSTSAAVCFLMRHVEGAVFLGTVLLIVGLGMPLVYFLSFFLSLRQQMRKLGLKRPQNVYSLELTEKAKGIHIANEKDQADYAWKDLFHAYRDETAVYLYMSPARAFVLPNADLEDCSSDALWTLVTAKVAKEKCTVL